MSVTNKLHQKLILHRSGPEEFWKFIADYFAGDDRRRWKYLAMLALRENCGWPLHWIGAVFGHPKGHVTRCLKRIKGELRESFDPETISDDGFRPSLDDLEE